MGMPPQGGIPTKFSIGRVRDLFAGTGLDGTSPVPPLKTQTRFAFWFLYKSDTTSQSACSCQHPWEGSQRYVQNLSDQAMPAVMMAIL